MQPQEQRQSYSTNISGSHATVLSRLRGLNAVLPIYTKSLFGVPYFDVRSGESIETLNSPAPRLTFRQLDNIGPKPQSHSTDANRQGVP